MHPLDSTMIIPATQVTEALLLCGVSQHQIGIISLYRQQIKLLSHLLHRHKEIELLTADRSQGRDKDCIIISMVKSNTSGQVSIKSYFYCCRDDREADPRVVVVVVVDW